jgi:hypothetical protein
MSAAFVGRVGLTLALASPGDALRLFGDSTWECARAPVRHVAVRRCEEPDVARSAEGKRTVAIECATVGCDAWATNARESSEPEGIIRVHAFNAVWTLDGSDGLPLGFNRVPVRLEDASAWFGQTRGTVLALRVATQGSANIDCNTILEFMYIIHFSAGRWRDVASGPSAFFAPRLSKAEVENGYAQCAMRASEETMRCTFEPALRDSENASMRCGKVVQRIPLRGGSGDLKALTPALKRWWAKQGK